MSNTEKIYQYQKLFNIRYNDKTFAIFIDEYNRKTFLEVNKDGKYFYPYIEDFIELHKIYNERDPFIVYNSKLQYPISYKLPIHKDRKFSFKEYVRTTTGAIALYVAIFTGISLVSGTITGRTFKLNRDNERIEIVVDYVDGVLINDTKELDDILNYTFVSKESVIDAINSNNNIPDYYKSYAIKLLEYITNKYPNTDLRIFYENMKTLSVIEATETQMNEYTAGTYNSANNIITIRSDHTNSRQVIIHEFAHAYHHWKENSIILPKYRNESVGHALDEAMTNKITNGITPTTTYKQEGRLLDYFLTCVDYDYYDYEKYGISKLITLLQERYPDIDINYIITSIDTMNETYFSIGEDIKIEDNLPVLDEIFKICIQNIDMNEKHTYKSFHNFVKSLDYQNYGKLIQEYLGKYNDTLLEHGYDKNKIISDSSKFIGMNITAEDYKSRFREYISKHNISSIPKNEIYEPFKEYINDIYGFIEYDSIDGTLDLCCELLDIYNDELYCNGYKLSDTITSEDILTRNKKYLDITVQGYITTSEDKLYPLVQSNDGDSKTIDLNGEFISIEENKQKRRSYNPQYYSIKNILYTFEHLDEKISENAEEYWQGLFNIKSIDYEKIPISNNGVIITEDYIPDIYISINLNNNGELSFNLEKSEKIIYQTKQEDTTSTRISYVPFYTYLDNYLNQNFLSRNNIDKIELSEVLTEDYLKTVIAGPNLNNSINPLYNTITYDIESNSLNFHPIYHLIGIKEGYNYQLNNVFLNNHGYIILYGEFVPIDSPYIRDVEENIYLETILDYYGILSKDIQEYHFTKEEVIELYNNYLSDIYGKTTNKHK